MDVEVGTIDGLFKLLTGGGFAALAWAVLKFLNSSQKDAVDAYALVAAERAGEIILLKQERDTLRAELAALHRQFDEEVAKRLVLEHRLDLLEKAQSK